ncbi:hypothetical protein RUM44_009883 [Polyplax serrata]|uniref:Uncharacterized protein n=1 Tax=Polyplax serrata TaxID=468196 RepID=A0ABR1ATZ5_POLSC
MSCRSGLSSVGANSPRPQSPPSPIAKSTTTTAITAAGGPRPGSPQGRCCDTGRPLFTDPLTGQTVCSCQYDLLSYQRLASAGVGPAGLPALSMYSAPYADGMAAYFPALGADQAPFYTPSGSRLKSVNRFLRVGELKVVRGIALNALKKAIKNKRTLEADLAINSYWNYQCKKIFRG